MSGEEYIKRARQAVIDGDEESAEQVAKDIIEAGINPVEIINEGFTKGMNEVGEMFANEKIPLPGVLISAEAMTKAVSIMEPHIPREDVVESRGTVVIGTVEGDVHDIGKRIVATMLRVSGFEVHDLGRDVPIGQFVEKAKEVNACIVGSSALMTFTMIGQEMLERELENAGIRNKVKTMIGGAATSQGYADKIGADAYGEDANDAVTKAKELAG